MSKPSFRFVLSLILIFIFVTPLLAQTRVGKLGVGVDGSMQYALGAGTVNSSAGFGGGVNMSYSIVEGLGLRSKFSMNQIEWKASTGQSAVTDVMSLNAYLTGDLMPNSKFNLFLLAGGGVSFYDPKDSNGARPSVGSVSSFDMQFNCGLGADYFLNEFWSISLMTEYVLTGSKYYNGPANSANDSYFRASLQVRYYFFDQPFITKLLESQRERSKRSK